MPMPRHSRQSSLRSTLLSLVVAGAAIVGVAAAIGAPPIVLRAAAAPQDAPSAIKERKVHVFEDHMVAQSLGQMVATADAVIVGDIISERTAKKEEVKGGVTVLTFHDVQVVEVVAGALPSKPAKITLVRRGGVAVDGNERLIAINESMPDLPRGRYVLFLDWAKENEAYAIAYGVEGVYRVTNDQLTPLGRTDIAKGVGQIRRPDLAAKLKDAVR